MPNENAQPEPIQITYAKGSDTGRARDHNEDYVDVYIPSDPIQRRQKGDLFIVADGMGGHQAGEVASEGAVRVILHEYYADPDPDIRGSLTRAIQKANAFIYQQAQQVVTRIGMGTTVVLAVVRGRELYLANVGDSRAYLMRQGKISQVTHDHSFVAEQIRAGILTREEARTHPQRNVITRALGSKPEVEVDTYRGELQSGDILLLCSDGLSEHVQEEDMMQMLSQYPPDEVVPRLIALANKRGGSDNISMAVVRAAPPTSVAPPKPAVVAARPAAPARKGVPLPWIVGIGAIVLIVVAVLVAGVLFLPRFLGGTETATPTLVSPVASPTIATATNTPLPTSTLLRPTESGPTVTPATVFSLLGPLDVAKTSPGTVQFQWKWIGELPELFVFVVNSNLGELCQTDRKEPGSCVGSLQAGDYEWWVEIRSGEQVIHKSESRKLQVRVPPTATTPPTPVPSPVEPPTEQPQPPGGKEPSPPVINTLEPVIKTPEPLVP